MPSTLFAPILIGHRDNEMRVGDREGFAEIRLRRLLPGRRMITRCEQENHAQAQGWIGSFGLFFHRIHWVGLDTSGAPLAAVCNGIVRYGLFFLSHFSSRGRALPSFSMIRGEGSGIFA